MRLRLATSPWWVQGLLYGVLFGAAMTVFSRYETGAWAPAAVGGLVGGALFGVLMGLSMSRINRRVLGGLETLSPPEQQVVARASWRGPLPSDPHQRDAARALLQRRRDEVVRTWRRSVAVFAGGTVLYVVLALTRSGWWWPCAALFLGFLGWTLRMPARMDRRLASFDPAED